MDLKQLIVLALQVSVVCTVIGFGLKTTLHDLLYLFRRPGLLARSLLAMFVVMPVVAVLLAVLFDFHPTVERVLIFLAMSPVPPLLPQKETKAGADEHNALALMAILALLSIAVIPLEILILQSVVGRPLEMASGAVVRVVLISTLLPLAAGMLVRSFMPGLAAWIEKPLALIPMVLLPLAIVVLLVATGPAILALIGDGTVIIAIVVFLAVGFAVGHVLGRPNPNNSVVLGLSTACRHPAIALTIAAANFPEERFEAVILLYLILGAIAALPYLAWHRRRQRTRPT
jgi:BASS family bile acid:Na+ symporter